MAQAPTATPKDTLRTLTNVLLPMVAGGAIVRRPRVMGMAQRFNTDARAVREMQRLRARYGPGPVQVHIPGRRITLLLEPDQVHRVLNGSPVPFAPATREKQGALGHFQPAGLLSSSAAERQHRRPFNDAVLQSGQPVHQHAATMTAAVDAELDTLLQRVGDTGSLTWEDFATGWWRMTRGIVLGDSARDDEQVTQDLLRLRKDANWSYLKPRRSATQARFLARVRSYVDRAEPGSLAELVATTPAHPGTEPHQQIPQWLFAFDAGAWATFRALALLCTHPEALDRARAERGQAPDLPFLRACVLESVRLWPTTPLVLRDTTQETAWDGGTLPTGASLVIFAPFFHRDDSRLPQAHRFDPELWLRERGDEDWPLVPFSGGPGMCPGRNVVLLTASTVLSRLIEQYSYTVTGGPVGTGRPVPGTLSPFALRFTPVS